MESDFHRILCAVRDWMTRVPFRPDILRDDAGGLRVIYETAAYLAELIVSESEYAPYRFVSFLLLDAKPEPDKEPVYSYYDREDSTMDEILAALDRGIGYMKERSGQHV